jgi:hypothetical protein
LVEEAAGERFPHRPNTKPRKRRWATPRSASTSMAHAAAPSATSDCLGQPRRPRRTLTRYRHPRQPPVVRREAGSDRFARRLICEIDLGRHRDDPAHATDPLGCPGGRGHAGGTKAYACRRERQARVRRRGLACSWSMWCLPSQWALRAPLRPRRSSPSQPQAQWAANTSGAPYLNRRSRTLISCSTAMERV